MGYDIDFLAVGENGRSGDAIALRYGDLHGDRDAQRVVVIDGGFSDDGRRLAEFVRRYYQTDHIDLVVSSHPDADHANGLKTVLGEMSVGKLWMHLPWEHTEDIARAFRDGRVTDNSIRERLQRSLEAARSLEELAAEKGISITEPFAGLTLDNGIFTVLGPSEDYYESLLPGFRGADGDASAASGLIGRIATGAVEVLSRVAEGWDVETLTDDGETSLENNSSTILQLKVDDRICLFTADAGIPALEQAIESCGEHDPASLRFIQIPHHGSRRNVGPTVLDALLGPKVPKGTEPTKTAFVSAAKDGAPKHPAKKVTNAFQRRGARVLATQGVNLWHHSDAPARSEYSSATPLPFYDEVEE